MEILIWKMGNGEHIVINIHQILLSRNKWTSLSLAIDILPCKANLALSTSSSPEEMLLPRLFVNHYCIFRKFILFFFWVQGPLWGVCHLKASEPSYSMSKWFGFDSWRELMIDSMSLITYTVSVDTLYTEYLGCFLASYLFINK